MNKAESKEQPTLPRCPNPGCRETHVVRNGSHRGRQRYYCCRCKTYFGETQSTPMYGLKTPAAEVAHALLIVMRRGSLRAALRDHRAQIRDDQRVARVGRRPMLRLLRRCWPAICT